MNLKETNMLLKLHDLTIKSPTGDTLLEQASVSVDAGVTALTGANGAGKSTLLKTIATLYKPSSGTIAFDGIDNRQAKSSFLNKMSYMPQNFAAYPALSGLEFLCYFLQLDGQSKKQALLIASTWLDAVGLTASMNAPTHTYSQGMLQRLGIAFVMQTQTPLCLLDEPFAGVDPQSRAQLMALLFAQQCQPRTILICTHHVDEVINCGANTIQLADKGLQT
jgi:ABC-type multidrug transport system ATPase subunit